MKSNNIIVDNHLLHGQPEKKFCSECGFENAIGEPCQNGCDKPKIETDYSENISKLLKEVFKNLNPNNYENNI